MGGFVLKEKIKRLKQRLKVWNKSQFGDMQQKIRRIEMEMNKLEIEGEDRQFNEVEIKR